MVAERQREWMRRCARNRRAESLFERGETSAAASRFLNADGHVAQVGLPFRAVFKHPTVRDLARPGSRLPREHASRCGERDDVKPLIPKSKAAPRAAESGNWWISARPAPRGETAHTAPADAPRRALLGVAHASSGINPYRPLAAQLPEWDVYALRLPGREVRLAEEPFDDLDRALDEVTPVTVPLVAGRQYTLMGTCTGAVVAAALAARLAACRHPANALVAVACVAPHRRRQEPLVGDAEVARRLTRDGLTPPEILQDEEYAPLVVRCYWADMQLARPRNVKLATPILALRGERDDLDVDAVRAWADVTSGDFREDVIPEVGHHPLVDAPAEVAAALRAFITPPLRRRLEDGGDDGLPRRRTHGAGEAG